MYVFKGTGKNVLQVQRLVFLQIQVRRSRLRCTPAPKGHCSPWDNSASIRLPPMLLATSWMDCCHPRHRMRSSPGRPSLRRRPSTRNSNVKERQPSPSLVSLSTRNVTACFPVSLVCMGLSHENCKLVFRCVVVEPSLYMTEMVSKCSL